MITPDLGRMLAEARRRDTERGCPPPHETGAAASAGPPVTIRRAGPHLVAEVGGRVEAAFPLDGTAPKGDAALLDLLELRARQLRR